jgi:hypothetical protein
VKINIIRLQKEAKQAALVGNLKLVDLIKELLLAQSMLKVHLIAAEQKIDLLLLGNLEAILTVK